MNHETEMWGQYRVMMACTNVKYMLQHKMVKNDAIRRCHSRETFCRTKIRKNAELMKQKKIILTMPKRYVLKDL